MKQLELLHIPTPKLIHFIKLEELNKCVQVFEWVQGVNGEGLRSYRRKNSIMQEEKQEKY